MTKPIVLQAYPMMNEEPERRLAELVDLRTASAPDEDTLIAEGEGAVALIGRSPARIGARVFDALPDLRILSGSGSGVNCFDVAAATERKIVVINYPGVAPYPVAEYVICTIVALRKRLIEADKFLRAGGDWEPKDRFMGTECGGKTLGLVGFGAIGRDVARRAIGGLDMKVLAFDPLVGDAAIRAVGAEPANDLLELFASSDTISVHVPALAETHHLIGAKQFAVVKPGTMLINTSRGPVIDEAALVAALTNGTLARAALDVFDPEPPAADNPLFALPNVIVTPHIAGATYEGMARIYDQLVIDVVGALDGKRPAHIFNPETWPPSRYSSVSK